MIKEISKISDLPAGTVKDYRRFGWTDEEIVENLNDAINFLNLHLRWVKRGDEIPLNLIFSEPGCRRRGPLRRRVNGSLSSG